MKVSILLITYNHEKYISDAIKSILMQKVSYDIEIILLDDASTDNTVKVASLGLRNSKNVSLIINENNLGITKNYQKGFSLCKGEYVFVLEGDDYWIDPYKIKKQVDFLEQNPFCVMCFHPFFLQRDDLGIFTNNFNIETASPTDLFDIREIILNEGLIANFSVCCYRKTILDKLPPELFDIVSYDWMVNISMAQFGFLGRINSSMSVYRLSETGVWSNKQVKDKLMKTVELISEYDRVLGYRYTEFFNNKVQLLTEQINPYIPSERTALKSFVPPILIWFIKLTCPPVLLSFLKKLRND